jgi:type III pantothenate kinase
MNLAIDIGNTLVKLAVFDKGDLTGLEIIEEITLPALERFAESHTGIDSAILATVKDHPPQILTYLRNRFRFIEFNPSVPVPLTSSYATPNTLGSDRLATVVAAHALMPSEDILVINAGTAITYDIVTSSGEHLGGAISPGLLMRFKALHTFTGRLPLLDEITDALLTGKSTTDSILSGVLNGTLAEVDGMIERFRTIYPGMKTVMSGGDNNYFDKRLKNKTFAIPNLVLTGLNIILDYNLEKSL